MANQKKISYKKARKKNRQQKNMERLARQMKKDTADMISGLSDYSKMIDQFTDNIVRLKTICHAFVIAQFEKYKDQQLDPDHEKYTRLAELQGLNLALNSTDEDIAKLKSVFSMMKHVRKDPMKSIDLVTNHLIPAISTFQIKMLDIFDMFKQIVVKNKEALTELAEKDPEMGAVLTTLDAMEKSMTSENKEESPKEKLFVDTDDQEGGIQLAL